MFLSVLVMLALCCASRAAFVGSSSNAFRRLSSSPTSQPLVETRQSTQQHMLPDTFLLTDFSFLSTSSNMFLSTIDSDIANIPTNEFAPVFMGGIVVMFGGVLSALIVGFILENGNLYANVVADSYAQSSEDEEFWKGLSDEEKKKAQALIDKLNGKKAQEEGGVPQVTQAASEVMATEVVVTEEAADKTTVQELDMFSDYVDAGKK